MKPSAMGIMFAMALLGACARSVPLTAPPAPTMAITEDVTIALAWTAPVDLDLYVTDPSWETVYFANNPSRGGGRLERDERCQAEGGRNTRVEIVRLPPRDGPYRIGVDFIDACGSDIEQVPFRIIAAVANERRDLTATASINVFAPIVLELALQRGADGAAVFAHTEPAH